MDGKALLQSKTFYVNLVAFVIVVLQATGIVSGLDYVSLEAGALGIINVVLRLATKQPISSVTIQPTLPQGG